MRWLNVVLWGLMAAAVSATATGCSQPSAAPSSAAQSSPPPASKADTASKLVPGAKGSPAAPAGGNATKTAEGAAPSQPLPATADLEAFIAGFQSPYSIRVFETTEQFRKLPPAARRSVLTGLSAHESPAVRQNAWRAFATWATRDDVPTLIAARESPHEDVRAAALALLAHFPNSDTLGVLTKVLEDPLQRERAEELLVSVGPAAEMPVLNYITHADPGLRSSAWRILAHVGSRKSLLEMGRVATQAAFQDDAELNAAMEQIRARLRK